jgi:ammonia channel protein AmtB
VAFFYGGMVQHKNVVSTIMQVFIALAIIPILWSIIGCEALRAVVVVSDSEASIRRRAGRRRAPERRDTLF